MADLPGLLGIGDEDVFDFRGIISAVIGVLIVLPIAGFRAAAHGLSPERRPSGTLDGPPPPRR